MCKPGPRQAGKTTLVRAAFPRHEYVSLESPDMRSFAQSDPRGFLDTYSRGAILDEVQNVPQLMSYIQGIVDLDSRMGRFILTGSQNFLLLDSITQSLAGRTAILNLLPFSMRELLDAGMMREQWENWTFHGFYPPIYDRNPRPDEWMPAYIQTYLERDIRSISNVHDLSTFQNFMKLCAGRVGQIVKLSSLSNDLGVDQKTVRSWLSVLETNFTVFLLRPYYRNFNKRVIKSPKIYFFDTGLACNLLGIRSPRELQIHYAKGNLFENFVLAELWKNKLNNAQPPHLYFWRDSKGHEVDCLWEQAGGIGAMEIKAGKTVAPDFFKGLDFLRTAAGESSVKSYLVYGGETEQKRTNAHVLPWRSISDFMV